MKELFTIQQKLNAPKDKRNSFGNYNYRSCEGILEALKPLLRDNDCTLLLTDEMVAVGNRNYVKATATLANSKGESISATAFAREEETKKGMDGSQITGAASSYARKYALNGLFAIDDNRDSDATNTHGKDEHKRGLDEAMKQAVDEISKCTDENKVQEIWNRWLIFNPAICGNGTPFYNAAAKKVQQLRSTAAK